PVRARGRGGLDALRSGGRPAQDPRRDRQGLRGDPRADPPDRVEDHEQAAPPLALAGAARLPRLIVGSLHTVDGAGSPQGRSGAVDVSVVRVEPEDWIAHRDLRLEMLADAPEAFWA